MDDLCFVAEPEEFHQLLECLGLRRQLLGRGSQLLGRDGVALRELLAGLYMSVST